MCVEEPLFEECVVVERVGVHAGWRGLAWMQVGEEPLFEECVPCEVSSSAFAKGGLFSEQN